MKHTTYHKYSELKNYVDGTTKKTSKLAFFGNSVRMGDNVCVHKIYRLKRKPSLLVVLLSSSAWLTIIISCCYYCYDPWAMVPSTPIKQFHFNYSWSFAHLITLALCCMLIYFLSTKSDLPTHKLIDQKFILTHNISSIFL